MQVVGTAQHCSCEQHDHGVLRRHAQHCVSMPSNQHSCTPGCVPSIACMLCTVGRVTHGSARCDSGIRMHSTICIAVAALVLSMWSGQAAVLRQLNSDCRPHYAITEYVRPLAVLSRPTNTVAHASKPWHTTAALWLVRAIWPLRSTSCCLTAVCQHVFEALLTQHLKRIA
jgi:hypothetical protein